MTGRPRNPNKKHVYLIKLTLRESEDDDLITALEAAPPRGRAALVKVAMRSGGMPTFADLPEEADIADDLEGFLL